MCVGSNDAPEPVEAPKPVFVRNPYLDEQPTGGRGANRVDRSSLYIPFETGIGFAGRGGSGTGTSGGRPLDNSRPAAIRPRAATLPIVPDPDYRPGPGAIPRDDRNPGPGPRYV